jgi:hypothetical protein
VSREEPPAKPVSLATSAAERVATIIDAAEKAAATVIDDAEEQARRHLEDAKARADRLIAEHLRSLADQLDPPASEERSASHLRPVESPLVVADAAERMDEAEPEPPPRGGSAAAQLLATQMAVSGDSREEIEARLRSEFEIDDVDAILDAILGPEE